MARHTLSTRYRLMAGTGLATLGAALTLMAVPAFAQDEPSADADTTEVVVTGTRKALKSAQDLKRGADTVVDSITSEDIGSFPDKSVAEALQRVAGITVVRFNGTDDTSHFSAEPSGVLVRGLMQVRSEFNGRDTFSANSSRGLSWGDVSPELMSGVDTYKNQTADLIEGGIAGTINLRTRLPFDSKSRLLVLNASSSYGDLAKKSGYDFSGIWSDRFDTVLGEFGFMANFAVSQVYTGSQGIQYDRMGIFNVPSVFGEGLKYIPSVVYNRENVYDRNRKGVALAGQWRSNDGTLLLTGQYNRSQYTNSWQEHSISGSAFSVYGLPTGYIETNPDVLKPAKGTPAFVFDGNGNFVSGQMSTFMGYVSDNDATSATAIAAVAPGVPLFRTCHSWEGCTTGETRRGAQIQSAANYLKNDEYTEDFSVNLKWDISDTLHANFDVQHVSSAVENYNASVNMNTYGNFTLDTSGDYPVMTLSDVNPEMVNLAEGGHTNAHNYNYYSASDHVEESFGEETAIRADLQWDIDGTWLDTLKVGIRAADRDQTVRWGAYNWANVTSTWGNQAAVYNADNAVYGADAYETFTFSDGFFRNDVLAGNQSFVFFNMDKLKSSAELGSVLGNNGTTRAFSGYFPVCSNENYRAGEVVTGDIGCYTEAEVHPTSEKTKAIYAMLKFGGPDATLFGFPVSGNIGLRIVETENASEGGILLPNFLNYTAEQLACTRGVNDNDPDNVYNTFTPGCVISQEDLAFNNGAYVKRTAESKHTNALPSFNIKFDLNDEWVLRFAASRAMSRPDLGFMKNYSQISRQGSPLDTNQTTDPNFSFTNGLATGYTFRYQSNTANPYLKPMTADQFDISIERYFASVGSFAFTGFAKNFQDYIQYGSYDLELTNNGVTRTAKMNGPVNGDGASIRGFEVAYQRFFDFLPAPFNGLGIQANYTHVVNNGIDNTNLIAESASGGTNTGGGGLSQASDSINPHALEGISKDSYNLIFMYEKPKFSARLAYNWRSEFLVTSIDCCVGFPIWQKEAGYLDASFRYRITDRVELSLKGSNLLDTDTVLYQQVDQEGTLAPNAWFKNDRRIQAGVQFKF